MSETTHDNTLVATTAVLTGIHIGVDLSKRNFLKVGGLAAVGTLAVGSAGCDKPEIDFYVSTVIGGLEKLKPLLPNQVGLLTKAISIAKTFNQAWQDGKFANAVTILENLTATFDEVIIAAGINVSDGVKIIMGVAGVALIAITEILRQRLQDPTVAAAVSTAASTPSGKKQKAQMEKMTDSKRIDTIYAAIKP